MPPAPQRLDRFMADAVATYYARHDPFRDFTTAPELTQAFGEILGLWCVVTWESMGRPDPVILAELGPGRGTLMHDARRAIAQAAPALHAAHRLHLVEASPALRARQQALLPDATFHADIATLPAGPLLLLANEFLDALPIRQFVRRGTSWTERFVQAGAFVECPAAPPEIDAPDGATVELCKPARALARSLADRLRTQGGAALFLDYGPAESAPGDSLQGVRDGRSADPLAAPGDTDITAHVDFQAFAAAALGATVHGPVAQGIFLTRLGLPRRTDRLARGKPVQEVTALIAAAQRLVEPHMMGRLFKALAICHPALPTPPGFEA